MSALMSAALPATSKTDHPTTLVLYWYARAPLGGIRVGFNASASTTGANKVSDVVIMCAESSSTLSLLLPMLTANGKQRLCRQDSGGPRMVVLMKAGNAEPFPFADNVHHGIGSEIQGHVLTA